MSHTRARCSREKAWHPSCRKMCSGLHEWSQSPEPELGWEEAWQLRGGKQSSLWALAPSCLPACLRPHSQGRSSALSPHRMGTAFSPPSPLLDNVGQSLSVSVLPQATAHPLWQILNQQGCPLGASPILYLYGRFLLELAFTHGH